MDSRFAKEIGNIEVRKNFELARIYLEQLVGLGIDSRYKSPDGKQEIRVIKYHHSGPVDRIDLGEALHDFYYPKGYKDNMGAVVEPPAFNLDERHEKAVLTFLFLIPELAKQMAEEQAQRAELASSALEAYAPAQTISKIFEKAKGMIAVWTKARQSKNATVTLDEVRVRKELADILMAEVFELAKTIIADLQKSEVDFNQEISGVRIGFSPYRVSVQDVNDYSLDLYRQSRDDKPDYWWHEDNSYSENDYKKIERRVALFVKLFPVVMKLLDREQAERLQMINKSFGSFRKN